MRFMEVYGIEVQENQNDITIQLSRILHIPIYGLFDLKGLHFQLTQP